MESNQLISIVMKIFPLLIGLIIGYKFKKNDDFANVEDVAINTLNRDKKKESLRILIYDDKNFKSLRDNLEGAGYKVYWDEDNTRIYDVEPYDLIIIDYAGVGSRYGTEQGLGLAKDIKKHYPEKIVILYSSENALIGDGNLKAVDYEMKKDDSMGRWNNTIDAAIDRYLNIDRRWMIIEKKIKAANVSEDNLELIRASFNEYKDKYDSRGFINSIKTVKSEDDKLFNSMITELMKVYIDSL